MVLFESVGLFYLLIFKYIGVIRFKSHESQTWIESYHTYICEKRPIKETCTFKKYHICKNRPMKQMWINASHHVQEWVTWRDMSRDVYHMSRDVYPPFILHTKRIQICLITYYTHEPFVSVSSRKPYAPKKNNLREAKQQILPPKNTCGACMSVHTYACLRTLLTNLNASCRKIESSHTDEWVMSHTWMIKSYPTLPPPKKHTLTSSFTRAKSAFLDKSVWTNGQCPCFFSSEKLKKRGGGLVKNQPLPTHNTYDT